MRTLHVSPALHSYNTSMNNTLLTRFNALSNNEQQILLALAVIYAPITQSSLQSLMAKSFGFELTTLRLIDKALREKLQKAELLVISPDGWRCNETIAEPLIRLAIAEPGLTSWRNY